MPWLSWVFIGIRLSCIGAAMWMVRRWERKVDQFWRGYDD